jgi:3-methyladenine DNA glycosylase AlkD
LIKPYTGLSPKAAHPLLRSPIHEQRLAALFLLVAQFQKGTKKTQQEIYRFYMKNLKYVNNWDLVDLSAWQIVGGYLFEKSRKPLYVLAKSPNLWKRRVAIIATFYDIKQHEFHETLKIAKMLVGDHEDLIHKAVGWMLREVGKRAVKVEEGFLKQHYTTMPRTMLRYAIERFPEGKRHRYLHGKA